MAFFSPETLSFLVQLAANNNREWFQQHKEEYEQKVREPALAFIEAFGDPLHALSDHFVAIPRKSGGSLMRVYRDVRFSKDKTPYKTNIGIHFRHEVGKDVHAPGFYVNISAQEIFLGAGIWRPDANALAKIRRWIDQHPQAWQALLAEEAFTTDWVRRGDRLQRPPKGYDATHPLVEELKYKDHIVGHELQPETLFSDDLVAEIATRFASASRYMQALCSAVELPY